MSEFVGKTGYIVIVDSRKGGWGHINADQIVFSDSPVPQELARPIPAVASEGKLDAARLGRWVQVLASPETGNASHPLHAWQAITRGEALESGDASPGDNAKVFETFDGPGFGGWFPDGFAFGDGVASAGAWSESDSFVQAGAAHSGLLSPKLHGTLRSPSFPLEHDVVHFRAKGRGQIRLIVGHFMLREFNGLLFESTFINVDSDKYRWYTMTDGLDKWPGVECYIELVDDGDGHIAVDEIRIGGPSPEASGSARGPEIDAKSVDELAGAYGAWTAELLENWGDWALGDAGARWLALLDDRDLVDLSRIEKQRESLAGQVEKASEELPNPLRVLSITDGTAEPAHIFIRGNTTDIGEEVERRFLEAIDGDAPLVQESRRSGRLELAERLTADENPLFARVMANRVWHHLFGRGIVPSLDNFGVLGAAPSHPELLDYLAARFRDDGYSVKALIRLLVTSSAYRMTSSITDRVAEEKDPTNLLLHRASVRRLESEAIRDSILAVANTLDDDMYGESVLAYLSPFNNNHRRPKESGPMDGDRRRTIYLQVQRNFLPEMQLAFDFPIPDSTVGDRTVSNVPAQSLALMNDEFVAAQARAWGAALAARGDGFDARVREMCERAWGRVPTEREIGALESFREKQSAVYGIDADAAMGDPRIWSDIAQVLFMAKEFIYIG